jgi:hypothetical protein
VGARWKQRGGGTYEHFVDLFGLGLLAGDDVIKGDDLVGPQHHAAAAAAALAARAGGIIVARPHGERWKTGLVVIVFIASISKIKVLLFLLSEAIELIVVATLHLLAPSCLSSIK